MSTNKELIASVTECSSGSSSGRSYTHLRLLTAALSVRVALGVCETEWSTGYNRHKSCCPFAVGNLAQSIQLLRRKARAAFLSRSSFTHKRVTIARRNSCIAQARGESQMQIRERTKNSFGAKPSVS